MFPRALTVVEPGLTGPAMSSPTRTTTSPTALLRMEGESRSVFGRAALCVHITRFAATVVNAAKDEQQRCR